MKVGDTVKLKPAMWQGIKPESYGLSFTGEYEVTEYFEGEYPSIKIRDFICLFDAGAFQNVSKEKEKEVSKFKVGDVVKLSKQGIKHFSKEGWKAYRLPRAVYDGKKTVVYEVDNVTHIGLKIHVEVEGEGTTFFFEDMLELVTQESKQAEKSSSALDKQVSGDHYKSCGIQPIEYIHANNLSYLEGNVIKYTTRHSKKNGRQDIEKAIHYLELILEMEYKDDTK